MRHLQNTRRPAAWASDITLSTTLLLCRRDEFLKSGGFIPSLAGCGGEDFELGQRLRDRGGRVVFDPEWNALNYDRPFTFRRLIARQENYRRKRMELLSQGVEVGDWLSLGEPHLRHRLLRFAGSEVIVELLERIGRIPDRYGVGRLVEPVYQASLSARMRRPNI
jgi:hypothetical protein